MRLVFAFLCSIIIFACHVLAEEDIDIGELKCEVCKATITELENELSKIDPKRLIEVGSYKLDRKGNEIVKKVPLRQSEVFLSDKLDSICEGMDNYARVRDKNTRKIKVLNLINSGGGMNAMLGDYDFVTDNDMNKSLKYYCERLIEEYESDIIDVMRNESKDSKYSICTAATELCSDELEESNEEEEPYVDEAHLEL